MADDYNFYEQIDDISEAETDYDSDDDDKDEDTTKETSFAWSTESNFKEDETSFNF